MKNKYDILKVFAILLVVITHITALYTSRGSFSDIEDNALLSVFTDAVYIFHMPLFIALSGAIFAIGISKGKYKNFMLFLTNKINRIIVPYLFVGFFFLTPVLIVVFGLRISDCISDIYIWGGEARHLWYLGAIFYCFMIAWLLERMNVNRYYAFAVSLIIVILHSKYIDFDMLQIRNGLNALPSFIFGMILSQLEIKRFYICYISLVLLVALKLGISFIPDPIIVSACCLLLPYPIIMILFVIVQYTEKYLLASTIMPFILKYSFPIYLFHVEIIYIVYYYLRNSIPHIVLISSTFICSIVISILLAIILRLLKLQFLIGEKYM